MSGEAWADFRPQPVDDATRAFGAMGADFRRLAPMYKGYKKDDCPRVFARRALWQAVVAQWFFGGLKAKDAFTPKAGIEAREALGHVGAVLRSFEPDHNGKELIAAFLLSLWFDDFTPSAEHSKDFRTRVASARAAADPGVSS